MIGKYADELSIGDTFVSHSRTIMEADVAAFTGLTWLIDPIFTDKWFAALTPLGGLSVPGPMVMAFSLGLTEDLIYGTVFAALAIDNVKFVGPTRPGNTIRARTEITQHRYSTSRPGTAIVVMSHEVDNLDAGSVVCTFERTMLVATRKLVDSLQASAGAGTKIVP